MLETIQELLQQSQVWLIEVLNTQFAYNQLIQMLCMHIQWYLVYAPCIDALNHVAGLYVAEQGHLTAQLLS